VRGLPLDDVLGVGRSFVLDNGKCWVPETFQVNYIAELCAGEREVWIETPEGNAKSTLLGIIGLLHILFVFRGRVRLTSTAKDQVGDAMYGQARQIVEDTPGLDNVLEVKLGTLEIRNPSMKSEMRAWSSSDLTGEGIIPSLCLGDELQKLRKLSLIDTWRGKLSKKTGQLGCAANAGEPGSPYEQVKAKVRTRCEVEQVHDGLEVMRGPDFVMHRHALLRKDVDVLDPAVVKQANPLSTITEKSIAREISSAQFKLARHRRMRCGIAVRDLDAAIPEELWLKVPEGAIPPTAVVDLSVRPARMWDCFVVTPIWFASRDERYIGEPQILQTPCTGVDAIAMKHLKRAMLRAAKPFAGVRSVTIPIKGDGATLGEWCEGGADDSPGWPVVVLADGDVAQAEVRQTFIDSINNGYLRRPARCWIARPDDGYKPHLSADADEFNQHVINAVDHPVGDERYRFARPSKVRAVSMQDQRVIDGLRSAANGIFQRLGDWDADLNAPPPRSGPVIAVI